MTKSSISTKRLVEISDLPDDALLRIADAAAFDGISIASAWRRIRCSTWKPVRIGGTTRFPLSEVPQARIPFCDGRCEMSLENFSLDRNKRCLQGSKKASAPAWSVAVEAAWKSGRDISAYLDEVHAMAPKAAPPHSSKDPEGKP